MKRKWRKRRMMTPRRMRKWNYIYVRRPTFRKEYIVTDDLLASLAPDRFAFTAWWDAYGAGCLRSQDTP